MAVRCVTAVLRTSVHSYLLEPLQQNAALGSAQPSLQGKAMHLGRILGLALTTFLPCAVVHSQACNPRAVAIGVDTLLSKDRGMPDGIEIHGLTRTRTGYEYRDYTDIPTMLRRTTTVQFDSALNVTRVHSEGIFGQRKIESDVRYDGLHASGRAIPIQTASIAVQRIDTVLPQGAFDGLALYPLLLCRAGTVGSVTTVTLFDTDELKISRQTFRVVAREKLALPSGVQPALRAELSTTQLPVTIWFTEAQPHRLLKVASANGASTRNR